MTDEEKFWSYVEKTDDCWWWKPSKESHWYGVVRIGGKSIAAHRYAYALAYGPVPEGKIVMHTCDNPACVRPDHLEAGTYKQNSQDMVRRGRAAWQTGKRQRAGAS